MATAKNREIHSTRIFHTDIELMWEVWVNPLHIANWWGPNGFTRTIHEFDLREEGEWKLTLHGPDGTNFANRSVFKKIVPFEQIVFEHFNPHFVTTILFTANEGTTRIDWKMLFDSVELREIVVKAHKADEGLEQNLDKLQSYLVNFQ